MVTMNPIKAIRQIREDHNKPTEYEMSLLHGLAQVEEGKTAADSEMQKLLAESGLIIQDPSLERLLQGMSRYKWKDPHSGQEYEGTIPKNVATSILSSHLIRTSYIDPLEAQIGIYNARCILRRTKMKMSEEEYERGGASMIDAVFEIVRLNYLSAINGRISLVMKSQSKTVNLGFVGKGVGP
jgi:hypothetical protein